MACPRTAPKLVRLSTCGHLRCSSSPGLSTCGHLRCSSSPGVASEWPVPSRAPRAPGVTCLPGALFVAIIPYMEQARQAKPAGRAGRLQSRGTVGQHPGASRRHAGARPPAGAASDGAGGESPARRAFRNLLRRTSLRGRRTGRTARRGQPGLARGYGGRAGWRWRRGAACPPDGLGLGVRPPPARGGRPRGPEAYTISCRGRGSSACARSRRATPPGFYASGGPRLCSSWA